MRVGLDIRATERVRVTGWERFITQLASHLAREVAADEQVIRLGAGRDTGGNISTLVAHVRWWNGGLQRAVRTAHVGAVHAAAFPPPALNIPVLWTVHDDLLFGGHRRYARRGARLWRAAAVRAATVVDVLVTDTETVRRELLERVPVDPARLRVIRPGGPELGEPSREVRGIALSDGARKVVRPGFILVVGTIESRKRVDIAVDVGRRLGLSVVLAGRFAARPPSRSLSGTELGPHVIHVPTATDNDLAWLYENAGVFMSCSVYEGYDFPFAEARAAGARTVVSDIEVHRELASPWTVFFRAGDSSAAASAVERALAGPTPKARPEPGWDECARAYLELYRELHRR